MLDPSRSLDPAAPVGLSIANTFSVNTVPAADAAMPVELSIVMPCLNEAETLGICIQKAAHALRDLGICGEIIVADNGSTDGSPEIAKRNGARLISVSDRGYGSALRAGFRAAVGRYIIMADSDASYDLSDIAPFLQKLHEGYDLVTGTRIRGTIHPGAMPWLHRYVGNPILTSLANLFFHTRLSDYHCGMRGFDRAKANDLRLVAVGMEFATELIAKASLQLKIAEIPISYFPDGRSRPPHLKTWPDGWRHLRFMLLLSPAWTFLFPGLLLTALGLTGMIVLLPGPLKVGEIGFDVHTLLASGIAVIIGVLILTFWLFARLFAANMGLLPKSRWLPRLADHAPLGGGCLVGSILCVLGTGVSLRALQQWADVGFGALNYEITLRLLIPGLVIMALGVHVFFAGFIIALLNFSEGTAGSFSDMWGGGEGTRDNPQGKVSPNAIAEDEARQVCS